MIKGRLAALLAASILLLCACEEVDDGIRNVHYVLIGDHGTVDISYVDENGFSISIDDVALPWSYAFKAEVSDWLYFSAHSNYYGQSNRLTAYLYVDNRLVDSDTDISSSSACSVLVGASAQ